MSTACHATDLRRCGAARDDKQGVEGVVRRNRARRRRTMESTPSTRYEIRKAILTDIPDLIRMQMALQRDMDNIRTNLLRPDQANLAGLRDYYRSQIQDEQIRLLIAIAKESSEVVGMGAGKIWLHANCLPSRSGELIDLWIDPRHRKKSLARRIVVQLASVLPNATESISWSSVMWKAIWSERPCGRGWVSSPFWLRPWQIAAARNRHWASPQDRPCRWPIVRCSPAEPRSPCPSCLSLSQPGEEVVTSPAVRHMTGG